VIVPRGGRSLVARVQQEARVPVIGHLEGNCHVYVDKAGEPGDGARHRPECEAAAHRSVRRAETLLVDAAAERTHSRHWSVNYSRQVVKCEATPRRVPSIRALRRRPKQTGTTEYLDAVIAVRLVDGVDGAIGHIARYGSDHTNRS
jgi:glutamate-5-semialdehyde dehydrogenase